MRGFTQWSYNNAQPVLSEPAKVVAKRSEVSGWTSTNQPGSTSTFYYVTFELESGERMEFGLVGKEYGLLVEGDAGMLMYQGTRYKCFERHRSGEESFQAVRR